MDKKRFIIIIAAAAVIGAALFFFLNGRNEKAAVIERVARPVKSTVLDFQVSGNERVFPGEVKAAQRVDIAFRVSGQLQQLPIMRGQSIEKGQLIAKLDPRDFDSQVRNAKAAYDGAVAQLASMRVGRKEDILALQASLSSAKARQTEAKATFDRIKNLFEKQAVSKSQYDEAKAAYDVSNANVKSAQQELTKAQAGARPEEIAAQEASISGLESQLKKATDALADTELRAPFSGVVGELYVDNYQSVNADQTIAVLQNFSFLDVTIQVPGNLILSAQQNSAKNASAVKDDSNTLAAHALFSSLPGVKLPLVFKEVSTKADQQTQTYATTFTLKQPENVTVLPGMVADVVLSIRSGSGDKNSSGFAVAPGAVVAGKDDTHYVWLLTPDGNEFTATKLPVVIARYTDNEVVIIGKLKTGDRIATAGTNYLQENDRVTLYEARP